MTNLNNIIEILAKQAMGGQQQSNQQGGLGGILGSVLGQLGTNTSGQSSQGGLGDILGSVLGGLLVRSHNKRQMLRTLGFQVVEKVY